MARGIEGLSREIAALFSDPEFMKKFEVLPGEKQIELMDQVLNPPSKESVPQPGKNPGVCIQAEIPQTSRQCS